MGNIAGFSKTSRGRYIGNGSGGDLAKAGYVAHNLAKKKWFSEYVDSWVLYNSDDTDNPGEYDISDIKRTYFGAPSKGIAGDLAL
jgi:hypothetical protein